MRSPPHFDKKDLFIDRYPLFSRFTRGEDPEKRKFDFNHFK